MCSLFNSEKKSLWAEGFGFSSSLVGIGNVRNKRHLFFSKVSKLLIFDEQEFFKSFHLL